MKLTTPLRRIQALFDEEPRPEHFTDYCHCEECYDHDQTLLQYPRESLPLEKLNNPGWDPICFVSPEAYRYLFPRLCELSYGQGEDYYLDQYLFHLENRLDSFSRAEKDAILELLLDICEQPFDEFDKEYDRPFLDRVSKKLAE